MKSARTAAHCQGDSVKLPRNPMMQMVNGFANGGEVKETPEQLMARMTAKYGASSGSQQPEPAPAPAPEKQAPPEQKKSPAGIFGLMSGISKKIDAAAGYANGGKIDGAGTPTSDSIPAKVKETGGHILVSDEERIVSAAQGKFLEKLAADLGFPSLDAMLEAGTGRPVGPTIKSGVPAAATGASNEDLKNVLNSEIGNQPRPAAPPMNPSMANVVNGSRAPVEEQVSAPAPAPVAAQTPGVARSGNSFSDAAMNFQIGQNRPTAPTMNPSMANVVTGSRVPQPEQAPAATPGVVRSGNSFSQAMQVPQNPMNQNPPIADVRRGGDTSALDTPPLTVAQMEAKRPAWGKPFADSVGGGIDAAKGFLSDAINGVPDAGRGMVNPPSVNPAAQAPAVSVNPLRAVAGPGATTSPAPASAGAGRGTTNPLAASAQKQNSFTEVGNASSPIAGPVDAHGNSMAATNEMKSKLAELTSTAPANAVLLGNSGLEESRALMDKWGREDGTAAATQAAINNPKSASATASLAASSQQAEATRNGQGIAQQTAQAANETQQRGQTLNSLNASEGHGVTARGQDITAQTHAAQLAGNPLDNAMKQSTVDMNKVALSKVQQQDKMVADLGKEQDPEKRRSMMDTLLASQGKNPSEHRYLKVEGGEEIGPDNMTKVKKPSGVYDTITQKFIPMDGGASPAAATVPQGAVDMLKKNPAMAADFDKKFGPGAAKKILGK